MDCPSELFWFFAGLGVLAFATFAGIALVIRADCYEDTHDDTG